MCLFVYPLGPCDHKGGTQHFTYRETNGNGNLDIKDDNLCGEMSRNRDRCVPGAQHRSGAKTIDEIGKCVRRVRSPLP